MQFPINDPLILDRLFPTRSTASIPGGVSFSTRVPNFVPPPPSLESSRREKGSSFCIVHWNIRKNVFDGFWKLFCYFSPTSPA